MVVKKFCASKKYLGGHNQIPKHIDVNFSMIQSRLAPQVIRGPFHKSFCAGVKMLEGLHSTLGVKSNPAKREINV